MDQRHGGRGRWVVLGGAIGVLVSLGSAAAQPARRAAITVVPHGVEVVTPAQPPPPIAVATAARVTRRLDAELLRTGKVTAIVDGAIVPATAESADAQAARGGVFIETRRAAAMAVALPSILKQQAEQAQLLPDELVMAGVGAERPVRVSWYVAGASGLEYSGAQQAYVGKVSVACLNADDPQDQSALPIAFSPLVTALGADVAPPSLEVTHFGRWYPMQLVVRRPQVPYNVSVTLDPGKPGASTTLVFEAPRLDISVTSQPVGFGITKARVSVQGVGLRDPKGTPLLLKAPGAELGEDKLQLDENGFTSTELRVPGLANVTVTAGDPFVGTATVEVVSPLWFLAAAVIGGLAGAFLRKRGRQRWPRALAMGAVTAVVMTVAYFVGINWAGNLPGAAALAQGGLAVVFVLGAVSALGSVSWLLPEK